MLLWLPLVAIWLLIGMENLWGGIADAKVMKLTFAVVFIAWGVFGLWGAYSLWAAVLGPLPVARATAYGLGAGIIAMVLTPILGGKDSSLSYLTSLDYFGLWMIAAPVVVAAWHIYKYAVRSNIRED